jgi:hypothetical protein
MLAEQTEGCALSKGDYLVADKRECISHPLFLEYLIFFVFFKFLTSLKKNKRMLRYKGGTSVTGKKTSSKHMEHTDAQCKETCAG